MANDKTNDAGSSATRGPLEALRPQRRDRVSSVARAVVGAAPIIGPAMAEVIDHTIPNQRIDRIAAFVEELDQRLREHCEDKDTCRLLETPEAVDLLEEGMFQAARALTDERLEYIACLLKNGLTSDDMKHIEKRSLLELLSRLNDAELIILHSYGLHSQQDTNFFEQHADVLHGVRAHLGSSQEEIDRSAIHKMYRQKLRELRLIAPRFERPRRGEAPELDLKTGMIKTRGDNLTPLGRLLLRHLDLEVRR